MKKTAWWGIIFYLGLIITGCGYDEAGADFENAAEYEKVVTGYFVQADQEVIQLDVTKAYRHYRQSQSPGVELTFEDMGLPTLDVKQHESLKLVGTDGEEWQLEQVGKGDKVRLDYEIGNFDAVKGSMITVDQLTIERLTPLEMIENYRPDGRGYYSIATLYREGEGIIDPSWEELSVLLDHPAITGFGSLRQQDDVPAADFVSAFDITAPLPLLLVIGEEGIIYTSEDIGQILNYVDGHTLDR